MPSLSVCRVFLPMLAFCYLGSPQCNAAPTITHIFLPGDDLSQGIAISADGSAVAGTTLRVNPFRQSAFRWTTTSGIQSLGLLPGTQSSYGLGINATGTTVIGGTNSSTGSDRGFRWTGNAGGGTMQTISPPNGVRATRGIASSSDGQFVGGMINLNSGRQHAMRWNSATGVCEDLGTPLPDSDSIAYAINATGRIVVGWCTGGACFSVDGSSMQFIEQLPFLIGTTARAITPGGEFVAGDLNSSNGVQLCRWTMATRSREDLGTLAGSTETRGHGITADGAVIVGTTNTGRAILWTEATGIVDLNTLFPSLGLNLTEWELTAALAVSADGTAMAGVGRRNGGQYDQAWIVRGLPVMCRSLSITSQPESTTSCGTGTANVAVLLFGSPPQTYGWQWRRTGQSSWIPVVEGVNGDGVASFRASGSMSGSVSIADFFEPWNGNSQAIQLQCAVQNGCSSVVTDMASVSFCVGDFNCSGTVDADDIFAFLDAWFAQSGSTGSNLSADLNGDSTVTADDIFAFLDIWFGQAGICE